MSDMRSITRPMAIGGRPQRAIVLAALTALAGLMPASVAAQSLDPSCTFQYGSGAADYRFERGRLSVVERRHFTSKVERLISGEASSQPGPDIGYTLNMFPNHHRALLALSRLGKKLSVDKVPEMDHSVICYHERALHFRRDDNVARMLYARHLGSIGRTNEALVQLQLTAEYAEGNPLTHYNIGLLAFELEDYDRALAQAHVAYGLGIQQPELRERLTKAGKWSAPLPAAAASAASAPSASTAGEARR